MFLNCFPKTSSRAGDAYARNKGLHYQSARQVQKVKTGLVKKNLPSSYPTFCQNMKDKSWKQVSHPQRWLIIIRNKSQQFPQEAAGWPYHAAGSSVHYLTFPSITKAASRHLLQVSASLIQPSRKTDMHSWQPAGSSFP